uniref:Uncharacterized protein n=1 Tax=Romanomermis culicivorax TaxID=13658 RepID=A0A915KZ60_ROMCU
MYERAPKIRAIFGSTYRNNAKRKSDNQVFKFAGHSASYQFCSTCLHNGTISNLHKDLKKACLPDKTASFRSISNPIAELYDENDLRMRPIQKQKSGNNSTADIEQILMKED